MFYFSSEILCSVSVFQMKAFNINFSYLEIIENETIFFILAMKGLLLKLKHGQNVVWSVLKNIYKVLMI